MAPMGWVSCELLKPVDWSRMQSIKSKKGIVAKIECFAQEEDAASSPQWAVRAVLRSHLDVIRAMAFHPVEPVLFTSSEYGSRARSVGYGRNGHAKNEFVHRRRRHDQAVESGGEAGERERLGEEQGYATQRSGLR